MNTRTGLFINMVLKGAAGFLLLGLVLFTCAGSLAYKNGWLFIISLLILITFMGIFLLAFQPETLKKRLRSKETEKTQKWYVFLTGASFLLSFVLAGLDYRFKWSAMPFGLSLAALGFMIFGYILFAAVTFQNSYASRVIEVQDNQKVIKTGLYQIVRHPMYFAAIVLFLSVPFVLGSYIAEIPMLAFPATLVLRIKNEEAVLISQLEGYEQYTKETRYRLIPYIW